MQQQMARQYQMGQHQMGHVLVGSNVSMLSAEAPFETPALPAEPQSNIESESINMSSTEMDYLLFGSTPSTPAAPIRQVALTPAPHSQNWEYHRQLMMAQNGMMQRKK